MILWSARSINLLLVVWCSVRLVMQWLQRIGHICGVLITCVVCQGSDGPVVMGLVGHPEQVCCHIFPRGIILTKFAYQGSCYTWTLLHNDFIATAAAAGPLLSMGSRNSLAGRLNKVGECMQFSIVLLYNSVF